MRPLLPADVPAVIRLVRGHEFAREHSPEVLRRLFEHRWAPQSENLGQVLDAGGRIVGVVCAIWSTRVLDGRPQLVGNMSTWYVDEAYRSQSLSLLKALCARRDAVLTNLSASPGVAVVLRRFGFKQVGERRLFLPAWTASWWFRGRGAQAVVDAPEQLQRSLPAEHRQILLDHQGYGLGHYYLPGEGGGVYVITKRRTLKGEIFLPAWAPLRVRQRRFSVSDVVFLGNPRAAVSVWPVLGRHIVRREGTWGLTVQDALLCGEVPREPRNSVPAAVFVRPAATPEGSVELPVDGLYSEVVLLPLS